MESSNPVLKGAFAPQTRPIGSARSGEGMTNLDNLEQVYNAPAASSTRTGRMTIDDVVIRAGMLFAVLVVVGGFAWTANLGGGAIMLGLIGGFILAMVNSFSKKIRPAAVVGYAIFQGLALGAISRVYESIYPGIVSQAILGTLSAFAGVLFMYRSGRLRATPKFTRTLIGATIGYFVLGLFSLIGAMFGLGNGYGLYGVSGLSLLLAVAGVALASFFLVLDFDQIEKGVTAGVPNQEAWRAGFGLMVTIIWLYLEVLRLLAILRNDR